MKLADISQFESLGQDKARCLSDCSVFNSGAAVILERFDLMLQGKLQCDKWIDELQKNPNLPADLVSQLYTSREDCSEELLRIKQQLIDEIQKSPLDAYDREVFASLSDTAKKELQSFIQADEVLSRAAEMEQEQRKTAQPQQTAQPQPSAQPPIDLEGGDFTDELQAEE